MLLLLCGLGLALRRDGVFVQDEAVAGEKILQRRIGARLAGDLADEIRSDLLAQVPAADLQLLLLQLRLQILVRHASCDAERAQSGGDDPKDERDNKLPHFHEEQTGWLH